MRRNTSRLMAGFGCLVVALAFLPGCGPKEEAPATSGPPAGPPVQAGAGKQAGGGSAMNTDVVPAPAGVKTGLEGGKKGP